MRIAVGDPLFSIAPTLNSSASAGRFFFATTLDRVELARHLARHAGCRSS
jgi:hypothetical protein